MASSARGVAGDRHEGGRHDAAGRVGRVEANSSRISAASLGRIRIRIASASAGGSCSTTSAGVVGVHLLEQPRRLGSRQGAQDAGRLGRRKLLHQERDLFVGQPLQEDGHLARLELRDQVGPLGGPDALGEADHALALALADEVLHLGEQLRGLRGGHVGTSHARPLSAAGSRNGGLWPPKNRFGNSISTTSGCPGRGRTRRWSGAGTALGRYLAPQPRARALT